MRKLIRWIPIFTVVALLASAGVGCTSKMKASYHLKRADRFFDSGQYQPAEIEYENVLRNAPQNTWAWTRLGTIYLYEGRGPEALPVFIRAQQLDPASLIVRQKLGTLYLESGQPAQARDEADYVLSQNPQDDQAPLVLARAAGTNELNTVNLRLHNLQQKKDSASLETAVGILALRQNDSKTATACFQRAIAIDPNFSDAYTGLGTVLFSQKDLKESDHNFQVAASVAPVWSGSGVRYAQFKLMTGNPGDAEQFLQGITAKTPYYLPAWMALARISAAQNDYSNALAMVGNVLNRDPNNFEALMFQGQVELMQHQPAQAITDYEQMERAYPETPTVLYALARAYLANNQTNQADDALNHALTIQPDFADAVLLRAETQMAHGNPALAIVTLKQLLQTQPRLVQAWLVLAEAYRAQNLPDNAIQIYRALESSYPGAAQIPVLLGDSLFQQHQMDSARAEFEKALRIDPNYLPAVEHLVDLDLAEKNYVAALDRVQQLVVRDPNRAVLQLLLGSTLSAQGETNQAESALSKAIKLEPNSQAAYLMLAQLYVQTGQNQKALQNLQAALDKDPNNTAALVLRGVIFNSEGDYDDARDAYQAVIAIAPDYGMALNNLACIYADHLNDLDTAYPLARRARDVTPSDPAIADTLGWILYRRGEYTPALVLLRESAAKLYAVPEVQFHLGMACYMAGFESEATTSFQRALQMAGDFPEKDVCRQRLSILNIDPKKSGPDTSAWLEKWIANHPSDPVALARLAAIYQSRGQTDKALATDQAILNLNPKNVFALVNLAQLYAPTDPQKAYDFAKSAYDLTPNDPEVTHMYGRLAFQTGDYAWALTLLQLSVQAQPQNPDVLFDLAQAFYSEGKVSDAQTLAQKALQTGTTFTRANDARNFLSMTALANNATSAAAGQTQVDQILAQTPNDVPALMVKALINWQKSDTAAAQQIYAHVLKIYPDFAPAQKDLVVLNAGDPKNDTDTLPLAEKARQAFPTDPYVAKSLGMIICRQGDYTRAVSLLKESAGQLNHDPEVLYYLGLAQFRLNNTQEGKSNLQRALSLNLSGNDAANARQLLGE
jgi:tetratricopeptide (TPR) repeat protein